MRISDWSSDVCSYDLVDDRIFRPDVIDEVAFIAKEADVVSSVMDDKLGVTVQEIKNFGQFLFEGRGALQEFVGETMDGESLGMDLTITWIEIALEIAWICRSRDLDPCDLNDGIAFLRFEAGDRKSVV